MVVLLLRPVCRGPSATFKRNYDPPGRNLPITQKESPLYLFCRSTLVRQIPDQSGLRPKIPADQPEPIDRIRSGRTEVDGAPSEVGNGLRRSRLVRFVHLPRE